MSRRPRANDDTEEHGFLSRWSRRKAGAGPPEEGAAPDAGDDAPERVPSEHPDGRQDQSGAGDSGEPERVKTDADMPDLNLIDESTDMSDFFSPGVSEELRTRALRRLFRMAKFNVTDGLDDYNEDFRNFALLGDIVTSDMRHRMEMDRQREASGEPAEPSGDAELAAADEHAAAERAGQAGSEPEADSEGDRVEDDAGDVDERDDEDDADDRPDDPAKART